LFLDECEKRKKSGSARSALGVGGQRVICGRGAYLWKKRSCFFPSKTKRGKTQKHQETRRNIHILEAQNLKNFNLIDSTVYSLRILSQATPTEATLQLTAMLHRSDF